VLQLHRDSYNGGSLGNFRDSPQAMARAIEYLSRYTPPWNEIGSQVSLVLLPRQRTQEQVGSPS